MRRAQVSLTSYVVSELHYRTNIDFDQSKESSIEIADYEILPRTKPQTENRRSWEVGLRISLTGAPERNFPCSVTIDLSGIVQLDPTLAEEYIERFVNINGVALIFGAAREIVRAVTAAGPSRGLLLPSVTFWEPKPSQTPIDAVSTQEVDVTDSSRENVTMNEK